MKKRILFGILLLVGIICVLSAAPALEAAGACSTTLAPGDDIQAAINGAAPGDVICLTAGTYTPAAMITVGQSVTLQGPQADVDPRPGAGTSRTPGSAAEAILDGSSLHLAMAAGNPRSVELL